MIVGDGLIVGLGCEVSVMVWVRVGVGCDVSVGVLDGRTVRVAVGVSVGQRACDSSPLCLFQLLCFHAFNRIPIIRHDPCNP